MPTPAVKDNILDDMYRDYPGLRQFDIQLKDSTVNGVDWRGEPYAGRKMEFYPPEEGWNPNPGKPTIELFSKEMKSKDAFGEVFSHYLPKVDPEFKRARADFIASIDSKQKEMLRGDYDHQVKSGIFPKNRKPTFEQWLNDQGGDAFFRGYVTDQYPRKFYSPGQIQMFDSLMGKLQEREYTVTAPDGKTYTIVGPPGSTREHALQKAIEQHNRARGDYQVNEAAKSLELAQGIGATGFDVYQNIVAQGEPQIDPYASHRGPAVPADKANFVASLKAGIIADPDTQRREIAKSLFPNDPRGAERVSFLDGMPVYVDDSGQLKRVSPGPVSLAADVVANVPEAVGATVGSFATGNPVAGAALGGAGGRAAKRLVSELVFDEPASPLSVAKEMAGEGVVNLVAGGAGKGIAAFAGRGKIVDFSPANVRTAEQARQYVKQTTGIDLDLAQASGDRKLLALRDYAARYPGRTAELIQSADDAAAGQLDAATNRFFDTIAKSTPSEIAGKNGVTAAQLVIDAATAARDKAVAPFYDAARNVSLSADIISDISQDPLIARAAKRVANDPVYQRNLKDLPKESVGYWHQVKRNLDAGYSEAKVAGNKTAAREYRNAAASLNEKLGAASPEYAQANAHYAKATKDIIEPLESSMIGVLAGVKDPVVSRAAVKIFGDPNVTPQAINLAKTALEKQSPEAYAGLVRQYLAHRWNQALKSTQGGDVINPAGKFRQSVFGTPADRERMRAMLPAGASSAFEDLMLAMEKLSRTPLGASRVAGSNTFRDQELNESLKGQGAIVFRWLTSPRRSIQDAAEERAKQQSLAAITEALLDPAKRGQLRQVARMEPSTKQAIMISSILGGQATKIAASDLVSLPREEPEQ